MKNFVLHNDYVSHLDLNSSTKISVSEIPEIMAKNYPEIFADSPKNGTVNVFPKHFPLVNQTNVRKEVFDFFKQSESVNYTEGFVILDYKTDYLKSFACDRASDAFDSSQNDSILCCEKKTVRTLHVNIEQSEITLAIQSKNKENSEKNIVQNILEQLSTLDCVFDFAKSDCSFLLRILVLVTSDSKSSEASISNHVEMVKTNLLEEIKFRNWRILDHLKIEYTKFMADKMWMTPEDLTVNTPETTQIEIDSNLDTGTNVDEISFRDKVFCMLLSMPKYRTLELTDVSLQLRITNGTKIEITDTKKLRDKIFDEYFASFNECLEILPNMDHSKVTILDKSNQNSTLESAETETQKFLGEFRDFCLNFVSTIKRPTGVLLYTFDKTRISNMFRGEYSENFESDWVWAVAKGLYFFEIGRRAKQANLVDITSKPKKDNPEKTVRNKLEQIVYKTSPNIHYIIWNQWLHFMRQNVETCSGTPSEEMLKQGTDFIKTYIKFVIYIPNVATEALIQCVSTLKKIPSIELLTGQVFFLLKREDSGNFWLFRLTLNANGDRLELHEWKRASEIFGTPDIETRATANTGTEILEENKKSNMNFTSEISNESKKECFEYIVSLLSADYLLKSTEGAHGLNFALILLRLLFLAR